MTDNNFELSRRKVLGSLGAMGVAGAAAGFGTNAYFSDSETFDGSTLTAGELDLKVDWEEHYSDWSADENDDREESDGGESDADDGEGTFPVQMEQPGDLDSYKAFPPGTGPDVEATSDPLIWIPNAYVDDFMDNTSIDAFPDSDNNGIADFPIEDVGEREPCDYLADVGGESDGLDPASDELGRTDNDDTIDEDGNPKPLIHLNDLKPGDFGEITFSTHLCDNPGYLWMNMPGGLTTSENGLSEPEAEDADEDQTINEDGEIVGKEGVDDPVVELADEIHTTIWYDNNCDNLITCEEKVDIMAVADTSQSINGSLDNSDASEEIDQIRAGANTFIDRLQSNATSANQIRAGLLTFNGGQDAGEDDPTVFNRPALRAGLGPLGQFDTDSDGSADVGNFLPNQGIGDTPMPYALDLAQKVLDDQGRPEARSIILLVTDGLPDYVGGGGTVPYTVEENEGGPLPTTGTTYTSEVFSDGTSDGTSSSDEQDETAAEAAEVQNDGVEIWVAGIGLDSDDDLFLENEVAGDDGDQTTAQPDFFVDTAFDPESTSDSGDVNINTAARTLADTFASGTGRCDEVIFTGTLREAADALAANEGRGIPLDADRGTAYDELNDPENAATRECFMAARTHCFGFSWWLPVDHANEIQTDGVAFDLGFYTEQCRHNDGGGQAAETNQTAD